MRPMELNPNVERIAAQWLARRDSDAWTPADQVRLDQWLDESTLHTVLFIRMEAAWRKADRLKALGAGVPDGVVPAPEQFNFSEPPLLATRSRRTTMRRCAVVA